MVWRGATVFRAVQGLGAPRVVSLLRDQDLPVTGSDDQAYVLWSGLWVDRNPDSGGRGLHRSVMRVYADALEGAMKEGAWPLFHERELEVCGSYPLLAPWRVAAVAAVLAHASGMEVEEPDVELWGQGGPDSLARSCRSSRKMGSGLLVRWGGWPGALKDGTIPLWLSGRGTPVDEVGRDWLARDCGPRLTVRALSQATPPAVSAALSLVNRDY